MGLSPSEATLGGEKPAPGAPIYPYDPLILVGMRVSPAMGRREGVGGRGSPYEWGICVGAGTSDPYDPYPYPRASGSGEIWLN